MFSTLIRGSGTIQVLPLGWKQPTSQSQFRRGGSAGRSQSLRDNHLITGIELTADDLGKAVVLQTGDNRNRNRPLLALHPDSGLVTRSAAGEAAGRIAQSLVRHADHVIALVDDEAARGRHAGLEREVR